MLHCNDPPPPTVKISPPPPTVTIFPPPTVTGLYPDVLAHLHYSGFAAEPVQRWALLCLTALQTLPHQLAHSESDQRQHHCLTPLPKLAAALHHSHCLLSHLPCPSQQLLQQPYSPQAAQQQICKPLRYWSAAAGHAVTAVPALLALAALHAVGAVSTVLVVDAVVDFHAVTAVPAEPAVVAVYSVAKKPGVCVTGLLCQDRLFD